MNTEMEIEYKSMIDFSVFKECLKYFKHVATAKEAYLQTNYYFDSEEFVLHKQKITLRLRNKLNQWELTAKIPDGKGKPFSKNLEINLSITEDEANDFLENGLDSKNALIHSLTTSFNVPSDTKFSFIESLETNRHDFIFYEDVVSLDINTYNGILDYEIEWETTNHNFVQLEFKRLKLKIGNGKGKKNRCFKSLKRGIFK